MDPFIHILLAVLAVGVGIGWVFEKGQTQEEGWKEELAWSVWDSWFSLVMIFVVAPFMMLEWGPPPRSSPPGPSRIPVFGNILSLKDHVAECLMELQKDHGPIMSLKFGVRDIVVVNDPVIFHQAMQEEKSIASRPPLSTLALYDAFIPGGQDIAFLPAGVDENGNNLGATWKKARGVFMKMMLPNMLSRQLDSVEEELHVLILNLKLSAEKLCAKGEPVDITYLFASFSMNAVTRMAFSSRCADKHFHDALEEKWGKEKGEVFGEFPQRLKELDLSFTDFFELPERFGDLTYTLEEVFKDIAIPNLPDYLPAFSIFPNPVYDRMIGHRKVRDDLFSHILNEHRKTRNPASSRDMTDEYLALAEKDNIPEDTLFQFMNDSLLAGTDTSAMTLKWMILLLARNPEIQKKAQEELDSVCPDRTPTWEEREKFPYLDAILKEVMRLKPVAPLLLPRYCTKSFQLGDYWIKPGTQIFFNFYSMARDNTLWKDAEAFRPERFFEEEKDIEFNTTSTLTSQKWSPFGAGRRACPGWSFAHRELFVASSALIHHFHFSPPAGSTEEAEMAEHFGLTLSPKNAKTMITIRHQ